MPSVTIDIEDLETLVFATGALKAIEAALANRKRDPFVVPHLDFGAAHDRCAAAMRNARRAESGTLIPWDGELTANEEEHLRCLDDRETGTMLVMDKDDYDPLAAKGCVILGQCVAGVIWPGQPQADIKPVAKFAVKITDRGREKLAKIDAARTQKVIT